MTMTRIFVAIALVATIMGCQSRKDNIVPENLVGVWKTSHPKYADRFLEIKNNIIIIGKGKETIGLHPIVAFDHHWEGNSVLYTISHINDHGKRYTTSLYYEPTNGVIRLKNQTHVIWTKEDMGWSSDPTREDRSS